MQIKQVYIKDAGRILKPCKCTYFLKGRGNCLYDCHACIRLRARLNNLIYHTSKLEHQTKFNMLPLRGLNKQAVGVSFHRAVHYNPGRHFSTQNTIGIIFQIVSFDHTQKIFYKVQQIIQSSKKYDFISKNVTWVRS